MFYKSTNKYKFLSLIGVIHGVLLVVFSIMLLFLREYSIVIILFIPGVILLYLLLYVFPDEVVVEENTLLFRTKLRRVVIPYSDIKELRPQYTTRTLTMSGGDKDKATVFYSIKRKGKPLSLLMFGGGIHNYRQLSTHIEEKIMVGSEGEGTGRGLRRS